MEKFKQKLASLDDDYKKAVERRKEYEEEAATLEKSLDDKETQIHALQENIKHLEERTEELTIELADKKKLHQAADLQHEQNSKRIEKLQEEIGNWQTKIDDVSTKLKKAEDEMEAMQKQLEDI